MIPRKLHYCWFGRNPLSPLAKKCIKSWEKYCKGYEIIEWNEDNFDLSVMPLYVRQAYEAKKWAFVTDYVRLKVVYDHGGIYMDTDVEVLRSLDDLLQFDAFFGFEFGNCIATGLGFGAVAGMPILGEMMCDYCEIPFVKEDESIDLTSCPVRNTEVFLRHGLRKENVNQTLERNIRIFSTEYFCPKDYFLGTTIITPNTYSIHHYDGSWMDSDRKRMRKERIKQRNQEKRKKQIKRLIHAPSRFLYQLLGVERYNRLKQRISKR